MSDPLPRHKNRHHHVELEFDHLKRRGVTVPQQVPDQAAILLGLFGALAIADPGRLHNGTVRCLPRRHQTGHNVHQGDQAVLMHLDFPPTVAIHDVCGVRFKRDVVNIGHVSPFFGPNSCSVLKFANCHIKFID